MTHLVHAPIDMRRLNRWAGQRGLIHRGTLDTGNAFHILLAAMFGKGVLQPFRLFSSSHRRQGCLYAYADVGTDVLQHTAEAVAGPETTAVVDPRRMHSKTLPESFEEGRILGYDLMVRPIRRINKLIEGGDGRKPIRKGAEVDAYRVETLRREADNRTEGGEAENEPPTRESAYRKWLEERLAGSAEVISLRLAALRHSKGIRGGKPGPDGPDATLHGTLRITHGIRFTEQVREGVGRHRAYGYGMLLLRPPGREGLQA